jgi:hypothetical protein
MKRLHVHVSVENLKQSIEFYSALFAAWPTMERKDYAKWMLEDPRVNFAISARGYAPGVNHLGLQADSAEELAELGQRVEQASVTTSTPQDNAACCYARSDKYWVMDPQGIAWESFHTLEIIPVFGDDAATKESGAACCIPLAPSGRTAAESSKGGCC